MSDIADVYDELLGVIRNEFADEAEDNLNEIDIVLGNISSGQEVGKEAIVKIKRPAHSLKGSAGVAEFPLVAIIMHKLEDYLSGLSELTKDHVEDVQKYIEVARELSDVDIDQQSEKHRLAIKRLPEKRGEETNSEDGGAVKTRVEAMMVIREKTAGMIFERELRALGLNVNTVRSSFDAIEMAVRTMPDIVIVSGVLDLLSGVDVVSALKAMPKTSDLPVALLTSSEIEGLPDGVAIIRKNNLKEDLNRALQQTGLLDAA